jgi:hypothetical protein
MTRQQLSVSFIDPSQVLKDGFTGLPITDAFLASLEGRRRPGRVMSLSRPHRTRSAL